jgi:hypothetical protein
MPFEVAPSPQSTRQLAGLPSLPDTRTKKIEVEPRVYQVPSNGETILAAGAGAASIVVTGGFMVASGSVVVAGGLVVVTGAVVVVAAAVVATTVVVGGGAGRCRFGIA